MEGMGQGEPDTVDVDRAALVHAAARRVRIAVLLFEHIRELVHADEPRLETLAELGSRAGVVRVAVRDRDDVAALGLLLRVGAPGIAVEPWIDVDSLPARGVEPEARVPEPGQGSARHGPQPIYGGRGASLPSRNVRPVGEAHGVARRLAAPGLAVVALLATLGGGGGFASFVVLVAIVAGALRLLEAVGSAAEGRSDRFPVVMSAAGLVWLVAAAATHAPMLVLGLLACSGLELLGEVGVRPELASESAELPEAPVSRAA